MRDLNEVIEDIGMGKYQILQFMVLSGIWISDGAEVLIASCILGGLKKAWGLSPVVKGAMMSMIFIGVCCGNLIGGTLADMHGRRRTVIIAYAGIIGFGMLSSFADGPYSLMALRFVFGCFFGIGVGPSISLQIETAPAAWRGHLVNLAGIFFAVGEVFAACLLVVFMPNIGGLEAARNWRFLTALSVVPGILLFPFAVLLLQESPHFLVTRGRPQEAAASVRAIAYMCGREDIMDEFKPGGSPAGGGGGGGGGTPATLGLPRATSRTALLGSPTAGSGGSGGSGDGGAGRPGAMEEGKRLDTAPSSSCSALLQLLRKPEYRSMILGGVYMCFLSNTLFYGLTYALPAMFTGFRAGVALKPAIQVLVVSLCDFPGIAMAFFLIRSREVSHRDGLFGLTLASALLVLILTSLEYGDDFLWVALPSAYLAKYVSQALFTLTYVYLAEVFPSDCRCMALSCCLAGGRVGSIGAPLMFEMLTCQECQVGKHANYLCIVAFLCIVGSVVVRTTLSFELKNEPLEGGCRVESAATSPTKGATALPAPVPAAAAGGDSAAGGSGDGAAGEA